VPSYEGAKIPVQQIYDYPTAAEAEAERTKALAAGRASHSVGLFPQLTIPQC